jgi:hypothetical protein
MYFIRHWKKRRDNVKAKKRQWRMGFVYALERAGLK